MGRWVLNDVVSISYIRIAIFVLALFFLALCSSEPHPAGAGGARRDPEPAHGGLDGHQPRPGQHADLRARLGHRRHRGRGHRPFAKVTSELGADYIVQSFMTVVVGGVGNIWGTLAGATLIGFLQKGIEWLNPSNTLAAQTYMILFIILFIQFRPRASSPSRAARRRRDHARSVRLPWRQMEALANRWPFFLRAIPRCWSSSDCCASRSSRWA
jgi:urea transport system permease protein